MTECVFMVRGALCERPKLETMQTVMHHIYMDGSPEGV
jgi:hypothetical protein